jgi:hypothetical protein
VLNTTAKQMNEPAADQTALATKPSASDKEIEQQSKAEVKAVAGSGQ